MNMDTFMLSLAIKACVLNVRLLIKENHYTDIQSKPLGYYCPLSSNETIISMLT